MARFAVLDSNNLCTNLIVAENLSDAESVTGEDCIELTDDMFCERGLIWTGEVFMDPQEKLNQEALAWDDSMNPVPLEERIP